MNYENKMELTKEIIANIKEALLKLDPDKEIYIDEEDLKVGEQEFFLTFPKDDIQISVSEFLKYLPEFESIKYSKKKVTTNRFTQVPIYSSGKPIDYIIDEINFSVGTPKYKIRIIENPILIGIAATKLGLYDKYAKPCSSYLAIEIDYEYFENRPSEEEELKLIKSFLFEISYLSDNSIDLYTIDESGAFTEYEEPEKKTFL